MSIKVTFLNQRRDGSVRRDETLVDANQVSIGRAPGSGVLLSDLRVRSEEAVLTVDGGRGSISAAHGTVTVNGKAVASASLSAGDSLKIGPYSIDVVDADGADIGLDITLSDAMPDDLAALKGNSVTSLTAAGWSKRKLSWGLLAVVFVLFLALPLGTYMQRSGDPQVMAGQDAEAIGQRDTGRDDGVAPDIVWDSGGISTAHKFLADDCGVCHQTPFVQVSDEACFACHADIEQHADLSQHPVDALVATDCIGCHKEHHGDEPPTIMAQSLCTDCHADLKAESAATDLMDATDFGSDHPEFRATLMTDGHMGEMVRKALDAENWPREQSYLTFPHDKHLVAKGVNAPTGRRVMECADCHRPDRGGVGMAPIVMERDCQECHSLAFDESDPMRQVRHADEAEVIEVVNDHWAQIALEGGVKDKTAPMVVQRRRPGGTKRFDSDKDREIAMAWAAERANKSLTYLFSDAVCGECHVVKGPDASETGTWDVVDVHLTDRFLPKGIFDHGQHPGETCESCHGARESKSATDVLLPTIAQCTDCHGGEDSSFKVPSTCVDCHDFHLDHLDPMKGAAIPMTEGVDKGE